MSNIVWTQDQTRIFDEVTSNLKASFILDACAGASKTTTLEELVKRMIAEGVRPGTILALAFNKKIAETLAERLPPGIVASTLNSFGFRALRDFLPVSRLNTNAWKEKNIWQNFPSYEALEKSEKQNIDKAHAFVKQNGALLERYDLALCEDPDMAEEYLARYPMVALAGDTAESLFINSINKNSTEIDGRDWVDEFRQAMSYDIVMSLMSGNISFMDQLYLPAVLKNITLRTFPHVLVDEAQDLGPLEHKLLDKIVSKFPKGRLIAVGDRAQAIYGFKGAHYDSLDRLGDHFGAAFLGLPVSFRCPAAVVREAQLYDDRIQVWDKAPEGRVERLSEWSLTTLQRPSTILCRVNYPLVETGLRLIKLGIGAKFLARDFEGQLTDFFNTWRKKSKIMEGMFMALDQEIKKTEEKDPGKANRISDMKECLEAIRDHYSCENFDDLADGITRLFNSPGPITLATIHKAKGLEWPVVYLIRPDLCPHPNATTDEEIQQENNMAYVAITRAQEYFGYLPKQD